MVKKRMTQVITSILLLQNESYYFFFITATLANKTFISILVPNAESKAAQNHSTLLGWGFETL